MTARRPLAAFAAPGGDGGGRARAAIGRALGDPRLRRVVRLRTTGRRDAIPTTPPNSKRPA